jgi:hypothetical protein
LLHASTPPFLHLHLLLLHSPEQLQCTCPCRPTIEFPLLPVQMLMTHQFWGGPRVYSTGSSTRPAGMNISLHGLPTEWSWYLIPAVLSRAVYVFLFHSVGKERMKKNCYGHSDLTILKALQVQQVSGIPSPYTFLTPQYNYC